MPRERQALEVPANIAERAGGVVLLAHGVEAHVKAKRNRLRLVLAALEAREDVRGDAEVRAAEERGRARGEAHRGAARGAVVLERRELRLRREPAREGLAPRKGAREALELERAAVEYAQGVLVHGPGPRPRLVDGRGDGQVLEVDEKPHHLRHEARVGGLRLPVNRPRKRQTLDAARQIWACDHRSAEIEKPLLGDGDVFIKLGLHVDPEPMGHEREAVVEIRRGYELQDGPEKLGW